MPAVTVTDLTALPRVSAPTEATPPDPSPR